MRRIDRLRIAMQMLLHRRREGARLDAEMRFHLDRQTEENQAAGMNPEEARRAAMRMFGNPLLVREQARANWSWAWLDRLLRNTRQGARRLRRSPGFAVTAVLVMALGIGATTSLFTIVRSVLLRPLPFKDPGRLVMLYEHFRNQPAGTGDGYNLVAPADFVEWQQKTHSFAGMAAWRYSKSDLTGEHGDLPELLQTAGVSWNMLSLLGVRPALGRSFIASEDQPGATPVVMLSWGLYERRFGANPSILGRQIRLDTVPYTVVGVLPRDFAYPNEKIQAWVPYAQSMPPILYTSHASHFSYVAARLPKGVSAAAAVEPLSALQYRIHLANPTAPVAEDVWERPMLDDMVLPVRTSLLVLLGAVGCVLLIACLNVSNLLVARGAARRKEVAVRGALGASLWQLIGEQMTESVLLCAAGGVLGLAFSLAITHWLAAHWDGLPREGVVHMDATVILFVIGIVAFSALLAGLVPAISCTRGNVLAALQQSSRSVGGSKGRASLRKALLAAEVALTVILLVGAGLLFKSFLHLRGADLGCATNHVMTLAYGLPPTQYDTPAKIIAFHQAVLDRVRLLPGVEADGLVSTAPGAGYEGDNTFTIPEHPATSFQLQDDALLRTASPSYFNVMRIPLVRGRVFTEHETLNNSRSMVVSRQFAEQFFPHEDPIGRMVSVAWGSPMPQNFRIVGVVGNTLYDVAQPSKATMYFPILSGLPQSANYATVVARTKSNPLLEALPMQKAIAAIDPQLPVSDVLSMQQIIGQSTAGQSSIATLVVAFASLSLLLAAVGLYGVLSYLVRQRVTEIGIRMALGAPRAEVLRLVLFDGMRPVLLGLVIGLGGAAVAAALLRSMLYGTSPLDASVYVAMTASLLVTAMAACLLPAFRASRIEPMQALRLE
jgi:predicted permease